MSPPAPAPAMRTKLVRALSVTAVLLVVAGGIVLGLLHHSRRGSAVIAAAAALAAVLRLILPSRLSGVLAVRSRRFDVAFLAAVTAFLGWMAFADLPAGG